MRTSMISTEYKPEKGSPVYFECPNMGDIAVSVSMWLAPSDNEVWDADVSCACGERHFLKYKLPPLTDNEEYNQRVEVWLDLL